MKQAGDRSCDPNLLDRVLSCLATRTKLNAIRAMLDGRRIEKVEFTNEIQAVGISLHLDNGVQVIVSMPELNLTMLLRDPDIGRQEQDLYHKNNYRPIRRRKPKKGTNTDDEKT